MMTDKELLELAAKAIGGNAFIDRPVPKGFPSVWIWFDDPANATHWNPLTDDGDALRLAVKLNLVVDVNEDMCFTGTGRINIQEPVKKKSGLYAATRRAIVRAAAEIGKTK